MTKLTGVIILNTLTNKVELKYYYNDKEITQDEIIKLKRRLKRIKKRKWNEKHSGVLQILSLDLYSNE